MGKIYYTITYTTGEQVVDMSGRGKLYTNEKNTLKEVEFRNKIAMKNYCDYSYQLTEMEVVENEGEK